LGVIEDERNELDERLFVLIASRIWLANSAPRVTRGAEQREEVSMEDETEYRQQDGAANADVDTANLKTAATLVATVFNVLTFTARNPFHG
jgi:phage terminase Nu1 subunit (DNA packaging protein)